MTHAVLITSYNRLGLLNRCIESIKETEPASPIFVVDDGSDQDTKDYLNDADLEMVISSKRNNGISPSVEIGIMAIDAWWRFKSAEENLGDSRLIVSYVQDDVIFTKKGWVQFCVDKYGEVDKKYSDVSIGFITGHEAPEHAGSERIKCEVPGCKFRDHIRATHMMNELHRWKMHFPVTTTGESGVLRGHPGNGRGSDFDWWVLRGKKGIYGDVFTNLVIPGILEHIGYNQSTWQPNELEEVE